MDTTDPDITFDSESRSNWVTDFYPEICRIWKPEGDQDRLQKLLTQIKSDGKGKKYDCILGLSGGLDSSYLALVAHKFGLRILVMHTDTGWNSELAVGNIEKIVKKCDLNLRTFVIDWKQMALVQRAFLRAGVPNQDIPQDHAIFAALYETAVREKVTWILNGSNFACESILPRAWGYDPRDLHHLKAIFRRFGSGSLRKFPTMGHLKIAWLTRFNGLKVAKLLNLLPYNRATAISELEAFFGWRYYGGKHYESRWTRYFQGWWLPTHFGYDKRLAHLSSLILSGQISKGEALSELARSDYPETSRLEDQDFIIRKLQMSQDEFNALLAKPKHEHNEYPSNEGLIRMLIKLKRTLTPILGDSPHF
jgi:N-acetyl sugar amidotransferase